MLEIFGRRRFSGVLALLVGAVGLLGMAQAAQAGTLSQVRAATFVYVTGAARGEVNDSTLYLLLGSGDIAIGDARQHGRRTTSSSGTLRFTPVDRCGKHRCSQGHRTSFGSFSTDGTTPAGGPAERPTGTLNPMHAADDAP